MPPRGLSSRRKSFSTWSCTGGRSWGGTELDVTIFGGLSLLASPKRGPGCAGHHRCPALLLHRRETVALGKATMGFLHLSFPPRWTSPGHEGAFGTWGTPPAIASANAATSSHPSPLRWGRSPQPSPGPAGPSPRGDTAQGLGVLPRAAAAPWR